MYALSSMSVFLLKGYLKFWEIYEMGSKTKKKKKNKNDGFQVALSLFNAYI